MGVIQLSLLGLADKPALDSAEPPAAPLDTRPRRRIGRPRLSQADSLNRQVNVRLSEEQYECLVERAERAGLYLSDYIRRLLVGAEEWAGAAARRRQFTAAQVQ